MELNTFDEVIAYSNTEFQKLVDGIDGLYISRLPKGKSKICTIIPMRGRERHLEQTLSTLIKSKDARQQIQIIVVEHSDVMVGKQICNKFNVGYVWICANGNLFNKCLCHNVGYAVTNSEFVHFHDIDLLVPSNFYSELYKLSQQNFATHCMADRRVMYFHEQISNSIFNGDDWLNYIDNQAHYTIGATGAPGGSIMFNRVLFEIVGGYDAHLYWGYSVEDDSMWQKCSGVVEIGSAGSIKLYHLYHSPLHSEDQPRQQTELKLRNFVNSKEYGYEYMKMSSNLLNQFKSHINKIIAF